MSVSNISIVFGPTLFRQASPTMNGHSNGMADASLQNKVSTSHARFGASLRARAIMSDRFSSQAVETILEHYMDIFVDESEQQPPPSQ